MAADRTRWTEDAGDFLGADDDGASTARYVASLVEAAKRTPAPEAPAPTTEKPSIVERVKSLFTSKDVAPSAPADPLAEEADALPLGMRWGIRAADGVAVQVVIAADPNPLMEVGKVLAHPV